MIIRNFYFAAWAIEKNISHSIKNGKFELHVDTQTLHRLQKEYDESTHRIIASRVKRINRLVAESANATLSCRTK
jgi:hypothetical protein